MWRRALTVVIAVAALAVMATPAMAAKGGNSAGAKQCQKGGWETQARTGDASTAFTSEEECVSYAAKGGTLTDLQTAQTQQQLCAGIGGTYSESLSGDERADWYCIGPYIESNTVWTAYLTAMTDVCSTYQFESPFGGFFPSSYLSAQVNDPGSISLVECAPSF